MMFLLKTLIIDPKPLPPGISAKDFQEIKERTERYCHGYVTAGDNWDREFNVAIKMKD